MFFDVAADACQFRRCAVFQRSVRANLVAKGAQEVSEINNARRNLRHRFPLQRHGRGRIQLDLPPLGGAVNHQHDVADFPGFKRSAHDSGFLHRLIHVQQAGEFKAPTNAAEFANLSGELLLGFDPFAVRRSNEQRNLSLSKRRRCVCSKQIAERFEFQHAGTGVGKRGRHRSSCYRENGDNNQRAAPRIPMKV